MPRVANLAHAVLGSNLAVRPHAPALLARENGRWEELSFAGLAGLAERCAGVLHAAGVARRARVLLSLPDCPGLVAAFLGALRLGAIPVVLNPRLGLEALAQIAVESGAAALIADPASPTARGWAEAAPDTIALWHPLRPGAPPGLALLGEQAPAPPPEIATDATEMAYWLYSSGTTGRPKAVVHTHRDGEIADRHLRENLGLAPGERVFTTSKLFFAYALGHSVLGALQAGATAVLAPEWPTPAGVTAIVGDTRPRIVLSVPTLYRDLLRDGHAGDPAFRDVRHFVSAGEPLPAALYRQWQAATGTPILEGLGTSETTFLYIANRPQAHRAGSTGRTLPWAETSLRAEDGAEVVAPGETGILWFRGPSVFAGYWDQPEASAAVRDGEWYCTGDVMERDPDGWWFYRGRRDEMFKVAGQWVSPNEIEQLAASRLGIADAAAVCRQGADELPEVELFVVIDGGAPPLEVVLTGLRSALGTLPRYKRPSRIRTTESIPRTATGKVRRFLLTETTGGNGRSERKEPR